MEEEEEAGWEEEALDLEEATAFLGEWGSVKEVEAWEGAEVVGKAEMEAHQEAKSVEEWAMRL